MDIGIDGFIRISPSPERAGPSTVAIDTFDQIESGLPVKDFVVTHAAGDGPERQVVTLRLAPNRFAVPVTFARGRNTITVVAKARDGGPRLRGVFELNVP
jgi:hypothetical protein